MSDEEIVKTLNRNIMRGTHDLKSKYHEFLYYCVNNVVTDHDFDESCLENVYTDIYNVISQYDGTVCLATFMNTFVREEMLRQINERTAPKYLHSDIARLYLSKNKKQYDEELSISINSFLSETNEITKEFFIRRYYCLQSLLQIERDMRIYLIQARILEKKIKFKLKSKPINIICAASKMDISYLDEFNCKIEFDYMKIRDRDYYKFGNRRNEIIDWWFKQSIFVLFLALVLWIISLFIK